MSLLMKQVKQMPKDFFVAGDLRTKRFYVKFLTAASDGANAIKSVTDYLNEI